ncbi:MobC family plasmid mobilization relaxosome protein [Planotetraspora sp. A-T 1434]|uniref:MobC family plasmid mobilization relaxosome protein n=1 Tax=Planotetraspora sp. A-T 1434 TaxID=2979219 RepID=UPI0021BF927D|nr:MobC family plasmid mobilization relaxosome protein [Planotetraspora sp. A-T 1434]MCT9933706.1 MobC family plasmid mobilization relaxosome protein [Planotetraspora sp. A-T 1434]
MNPLQSKMFAMSHYLCIRRVTEGDIYDQNRQLLQVRPQWALIKGGPGSVVGGAATGMSDGGEEAGSRKVRQRRRERQTVPRPHVVKFVLTAEEEYADFRRAAQRLGRAHGAYAAEAALAAARMADPPMPDPLREALIELMHASGQVRRIGVNLNQAIAALNTTGADPGNLVPYAPRACEPCSGWTESRKPSGR